jgi:uncharacterized protein (DUF488 family)
VTPRKPVFTIGHGSRTLEEFLTLLERAGIQCLVDVRAFPGSRRHPHFGREALQSALLHVGIEYIWEGEALGGRRRVREGSPHVALRNASFRAYADHMQSDVFRAGAQRLLQLGAGKTVAIMCAERLPWQCHRYMIADYLTVGGTEVCHLIDAANPRAHEVRAEVRVSAGGLVYDAGTQGEIDY